MSELSLQYKKIGQGFPLIILHGLYGSGSNWLSIARELSSMAEIYLVDQRNHGDSPHNQAHSYPDLMNDLIRFMDEQEIRQAIVLGHSMGGKVALWAAIHHPERISRLIIADISPLAYDASHPSRKSMGGHQKILSILAALEPEKFRNLREIDQALEKNLPEKALRQFLLKNLEKSDLGNYSWKINLSALAENLDKMAAGIDPSGIPMEGIRQFPVLFIKGENSDYIQKEDERAIRRIFPLASIIGLKNAGHWLHAEQPELFVRTVKRFIIGD